jgi:putative zinc finger protein
MTDCTQWHERIALAAGGDLCEGEYAELERHVAQCPPCAEALAALRGNLILLREAHEEPIAEMHFAAVRARVMSRIDARRRQRWAWGAVFASVAAALAASVWMRTTPVPDPPVAAAGVTGAAIRGTDVPLADRRPQRSTLRRRPARGPAADRGSAPLPSVSTEPIVVKLLTDDPNVVIYWIGDTP